MPTWNPGPDPFPAGETEAITDFTYLGELKFVRHAKVHVDKTPRSLWQLSADFGARMTVRGKDGSKCSVTLTAPRGMFTDLASVPEALWSIVGPIGPHLEASIIHDYLYMAWTDFRDEAEVRRSDWDFADAMFWEGMGVSGVDPFERELIHKAVRLAGWNVFRKKSYTLAERMDDWLPLLGAHDRDMGPAGIRPTTEAFAAAVNRRSARRDR